MGVYVIYNTDGSVKGVQTMTDAMAQRMESKGYVLTPTDQVSTTDSAAYERTPETATH